ncbi:hypothetical protein ACWKSP_11460 [Micromonosporaceae bacterium Da 78-11]
MTPAPPSFPVIRRIPTDQPFTVHPSLRKRLVVFGGVWATVAVLLLCIFGLASVGDDVENTGALFAVWAVIVVFFGAVVFPVVWSISSGGPVLALGPAGLWIKTRPTRGQAIWLPWEAVALISRRRWSFEKMLVVQPRDPRAGGNLGAFTAIDASLTKAFYGSGFTATLNMADRTEAEILQAVAYFAANRVPLT